MLLHNTTSAKMIRDLATLSSVLLLYGHRAQFSCVSRFRMTDAETTTHGYQIHPTWSLCPSEPAGERQVDTQGVFSRTRCLQLGKWIKQTDWKGCGKSCRIRASASQTYCPQVLHNTTAKQIQTDLHHTRLRQLSSSPSHSSAQVDRASSYPSSVSWDQGYSSPGDRETQ